MAFAVGAPIILLPSIIGRALIGPIIDYPTAPLLARYVDLYMWWFVGVFVLVGLGFLAYGAHAVGDAILRYWRGTE